MTNAMTRVIVGYDVGGAHLKVAVAVSGRLTAVRQIACPLWRGLDQLDIALAEAQALTAGLLAETIGGHGGAEHRVTMTGELADVFPDRYTGVALLVERMADRLGPATRFWMARPGDGGSIGVFGTASEAVARYTQVASTNFLAGAALAARHCATAGLLIDMGSTTTDIVPFADGRPIPRGYTDAERLHTGELVYTGLTRTPVMAVTSTGVLDGRIQGLARDPFATMADVYRVLDRLPDGVDLHATADGRGTSLAESRARLARCFGRDDDAEASLAGAEHWLIAARHIAAAQARSIEDGCHLVLSALPHCRGLVVSAGIGAPIVAAIATRLGASHRTLAEVAGIPADVADSATRCAPAAALALLTE
jgi:probable H4MPT-linked C1 transfer pathway protein